MAAPHNFLYAAGPLIFTQAVHTIVTEVTVWIPYGTKRLSCPGSSR